MFEALGQAPIVAGDRVRARERALDEALRQAVEQATATVLEPAELVARASDLKLRIYPKAKSYVSTYRILDEGEQPPGDVSGAPVGVGGDGAPGARPVERHGRRAPPIAGAQGARGGVRERAPATASTRRAAAEKALREMVRGAQRRGHAGRAAVRSAVGGGRRCAQRHARRRR